MNGCRALFLGWAQVLAPEAVVSYHFCPPCDTAYLVVDERPSGGHLLVLKGKVDDVRFAQHPPDHYRHLHLSDRESRSRERAGRRGAPLRHGAPGPKTVRCARNRLVDLLASGAS